jgi:hypothetical protein
MPLLVKQKGFGRALMQGLLGMIKGRQQSLTPAVDWLHSLIGSAGWQLVALPLICNPSFSFMGGVGKKVNN